MEEAAGFLSQQVKLSSYIKTSTVTSFYYYGRTSINPRDYINIIEVLCKQRNDSLSV